jgi:predicted transposase YbfD/YdcC
METLGLMIVHIFKPVEDCRIDRNKLYPLDEILLVALATILSGGETYTDMHDFGNGKLSFLKTLLPFEHGIPSEDTFERVFSLLNPKQFEKCFAEWVNALKEHGNSEIIAIDGKTLRRSGSKQLKPLHVVNAWACHNRLVLGCKATEEKSNEITVIPEVLELLSLKNTTVTIDAMGCQTAIVDQIVEAGGDYAIALKSNQGSLHDDVKTFFTLEDPLKNDSIQIIRNSEKNHGRIEIRTQGFCGNVTWLRKLHPRWKSIKGIGFVSTTRITGSKETNETRFFICSFDRDVNRFAEAIRLHWGIENSLHWVLDVLYREDDSRVRNRNAAANLAILRRVALNKVESETTLKVSRRRRRLRAALQDDYLKTLLFT